MSIHFKATFNLTEWAEDGDTRLRDITLENWGSDHSRPWTNLLLHGAVLTPEELPHVQAIQAAMMSLAAIHKPVAAEKGEA